MYRLFKLIMAKIKEETTIEPIEFDDEANSEVGIMYVGDDVESDDEVVNVVHEQNRISLFNNIQVLVDIIEDMQKQGKLVMEQSYKAYGAVLEINRLINEI